MSPRRGAGSAVGILLGLRCLGGGEWGRARDREFGRGLDRRFRFRLRGLVPSRERCVCMAELACLVGAIVQREDGTHLSAKAFEEHVRMALSVQVTARIEGC